MKLYITDIQSIRPDCKYEISPQRAEKVKKYRRAEDKKRCIAGGLLLKQFLGDKEIFYNPYGKPYCSEKVFFNLSHSGSYVLLALSDCEVGCDIEKIRYVDTEKTGKIVFCGEEQSQIKSAKSASTEFFKLWTKKESLLKCLGDGFHRPAKSVCVCSDIFEEKGKKYYLKSWIYSDYAVSVCSERNNLPKDIEYIHFSNNGLFP